MFFQARMNGCASDLFNIYPSLPRKSNKNRLRTYVRAEFAGTRLYYFPPPDFGFDSLLWVYLINRSPRCPPESDCCDVLKNIAQVSWSGHPRGEWQGLSPSPKPPNRQHRRRRAKSVGSATSAPSPNGSGTARLSSPKSALKPTTLPAVGNGGLPCAVAMFESMMK